MDAKRPGALPRPRRDRGQAELRRGGPAAGPAQAGGRCARAEQIAPHADRDARADRRADRGRDARHRGRAGLRARQPALPHLRRSRSPDSHAAGAGDTFVSALDAGARWPAQTPRTRPRSRRPRPRIVVAKPGTTTCSVDELKAYFLGGDKYYRRPAAAGRTARSCERHGLPPHRVHERLLRHPAPRPHRLSQPGQGARRRARRRREHATRACSGSRARPRPINTWRTGCRCSRR